ncbi:hypothetical protein ASPZODRAFT_130348 [Penicilliopsis zonata CBS 506.65]|uniref:Putative zinc-finger domain-containing protein n=1 Tax=Penicilliopsis zonata CBS 506.65 TaxID=1073090 RepID=A0A1L9SML3_9EURO|nr:hypothetical protein ASPZODRAFT_130348 [Penicilliopsis zonata CBS 506.65]OJJ48353.1 hypothetical protein ASPZODRAFT_130348 [Penicilliopsis zonata CBS 506.65]
MSNYPPSPSFGAPFNYTPWPSHYPPTPGSNLGPQNLAFPSDYSNPAQQPRMNVNLPDYNNMGGFNANARIPLPGLGAAQHAPAPFLPPGFAMMNQLNPSQLPPPPFPPVPVPSVRYPPMPPPVPPIQSQQQPMYHPNIPTSKNSHPTNVSEIEKLRAPIVVEDREEGELSDGEESASCQKPGSRNRSSLPAASQQLKDLGSTRKSGSTQHSNAQGTSGPALPSHMPSESETDSEDEGKASSSEIGSRDRDSSSPYNPPVSVALDSPVVVATAVSEAPSTSKSPSGGRLPHASSTPLSEPTKSHAQLRVQAQGALLSLAPHNIRYTELVQEGINPVVLKRLYEEVGIKVASPQSPTDLDKDNVSLGSDISVTPIQKPDVDSNQSLALSDEPVSIPVLSENLTSEKAKMAKEITPALPQPDSQTTTNKPLERKEVIARMLAAKAAKASAPSPAPVKTLVQLETTTKPPPAGPEPDERLVSITPSTATSAKDVSVKEKNKAQTELARQRIEQLKKQGLMRSQQKTQVEVAPQNQLPELSESLQVVDQAFTPSPFQHPLPSRPPEPGSFFGHIPGLSMMHSQQQSSSQEPASRQEEVFAAELATQTRSTHRKRPIASDFDESSIIPKRPFGQSDDDRTSDEKLIIDISDDENLYGDDEDGLDLESSTNRIFSDDRVPNGPQFALRSQAASTDFSLGRSAGLSHARPSASSTPQTPFRNSDHEDLRRKDLEIQAMRRRIAEMEQRRKAKLAASRTKSPGPLDSSTSPSGTSSPSDVQSVKSSGLSPAELSTSLPILGRKTPLNLASADFLRLEALRSKLQRKKEIELGLPDLDAEILKSEEKLAECRIDENNLLREITKGKQGRQQLLQELESLDTEVDGVTFDDIDAAETQIRNEDVSQLVEEAPNPVPLVSPDSEDVTIPDAPNLEDTPEEIAVVIPNPNGISESGLPADSVIPASWASIEPELDAPVDAEVIPTVTESGFNASPTLSESSGSAMDESSDSSRSTRSPSVDQQPSRQISAAAATATTSPETAQTEAIDNVPKADHLGPMLVPSPELTRNVVPEPEAQQSELDVERLQSSRESSVASEAYEPPEPEVASECGDGVDTPPFSPAPPEPIEPMEISIPSDTITTADSPLMGTVQEPDLDQNQASHSYILEDEWPSEQPKAAFSPYRSPLKMFRAYRYHPNFSQNVSGGYRSLTYSHNIDPMRSLCPYEADGGVCNDHSCEFQHFRDITLSDDKILVQMGSLREGKTPEEKDDYITGLKQIINDMRRDKVKDFNTVATEIAAYRRRFLQDASRILPL